MLLWTSEYEWNGILFDKTKKYCAWHDLVPFVQFKKRGKHPWRSANSSACNFTKSYSNKPHGHDMIDICMLEICSASIYRPLKIIYKARLEVFSF